MDQSLTSIRHERSMKDFPGLRLEKDEYVEFAFRRAKICLIFIFGGMIASLVVILMALILAMMGESMLDDMGKNFMFIIIGALCATVVLAGLIALMIYHGNRLYVTNKHVIQQVMESPVSNSTNMIDLASVEDASFHQNGILPTLFHYGTLRLATVGDETTYTFKYSDISSEDLKTISMMITKAKKVGKKPGAGHKHEEAVQA